MQYFGPEAVYVATRCQMEDIRTIQQRLEFFRAEYYALEKVQKNEEEKDKKNEESEEEDMA